MKYDEVYDYIGQMGWFQWNVFVTMFLFTMSTIESITMIFVGADMPHFCMVEELGNFSYDLQKYIAIPTNEDGEYESCEMYAFDYGNYSREEFLNWNRTEMVENGTGTVACSRWIYEQVVFVSTIVSRFGLVCGEGWMNQLISTVYMAGTLIGGVASGAMSDRIGRKLATMIYHCIRLVGFVLATFAPNYPICVVGRFVLGVGSSGCFLCAYVLVMEIVGPRFRTLIGCSLQISLSLGFMLQPLISSVVRHDVKYQMAALGPTVVFLTYIYLIPESPRWLVVTGKLSKGQKLLKDICAVNGTRLPDNLKLTTIESEEDFGEKNCLALLRTPRMRQRTIVISYLWFTCSLMYYAMSLNTGSLSGDIFINTLISGAVEIPSLIVCVFLLGWKHTGRRFSCSISFIGAGLSSVVCIPLILQGFGSAVTGMSMVGKAFITMTYSIIYVFASEVFPTEVRNVGLGTGSLFGGIGSMIAPFVGAPMAKIWEPLPSVVFGTLATVAGFLAMLLPETLGQHLFDTVEQAEEFCGGSTPNFDTSDHQPGKLTPTEDLQESPDGALPREPEKTFHQSNHPSQNIEIKNSYEIEVKGDNTSSDNSDLVSTTKL